MKENCHNTIPYIVSVSSQFTTAEFLFKAV